MTCTMCGASFAPKGQRRFTCSHACATERKRRHKRATTEQYRLRWQQMCACCGGIFEAVDDRTMTCGKSCGGRIARLQIREAA